jgi:N-methylhydantoinase B
MSMRTRRAAMNPVTYEVVRSRLLAITDEMRIALQSVSGSPTVTEACDFFTGLFLPDGSFVSMGFQVTFQAPVIGHLIKAVLDRKYFQLEEGDMFCGNDPFVGALHQNDVQLAGPIFANGQVIAWAGVEAHVTDIGGMDFASWSPRARDTRQEGLRIPCVKLVEGGRVREDILEMILTATRLPAQLGLDFRAFIATLNVARERVGELVARYGAETLVAVMGEMIADSETRFRARLAQMPNGEIHAVDYLEHDGHANELYRVDLYLTKSEEHLTFDFSGSSPQAPGFVNSTRSGLEGGTIGSLLPTLAYDIPWNQGVYRAISIVAPDGLICTAKYPAPVGAATVETIWVVNNVVNSALNKLLACTDGYRHRAHAVSDGTMSTFNLGGVNQYGEPFGLHLLDPFAGGFGAFASKDGFAASGPNIVPVPAIADVERNEQAVPLFYLHRRVACDSGGAGMFRGGLGTEIAITLRGTEHADALIMTHGAEVPNSIGQLGGYPASTVVQMLGEQAAPAGVLRPDADWLALGPKPGLRRMRQGDVFSGRWQGGGGWGDPLDRDVQSVAADLRAGAISLEAAREVYGVVCKGEHVDEAATDLHRSELRRKRIGGEFRPVNGSRSAKQVGSIGHNLLIVQSGSEFQVVSKGGYVLARGSTRWRSGAVKAKTHLPDCLGIRLHQRLAMTSYYCPSTGQLLAVDVHEVDHAPIDDIVLDLDSLERAEQVAAAE